MSSYCAISRTSSARWLRRRRRGSRRRGHRLQLGADRERPRVVGAVAGAAKRERALVAIASAVAVAELAQEGGEFAQVGRDRAVGGDELLVDRQRSLEPRPSSFQIAEVAQRAAEV